jgi:hypothetical protein
LTTSGESRPGLTSADWTKKQEQSSTGRGSDFNRGALRDSKDSEGGTSSDAYYIRREPYPLYDQEQANRIRVVFFILGLFVSIVALGLVSLTIVTLADKSGELISSYLTTALIPVSSLLTGVGAYFFGQHKARQELRSQGADLVKVSPPHD